MNDFFFYGNCWRVWAGFFYSRYCVRASQLTWLNTNPKPKVWMESAPLMPQHGLYSRPVALLITTSNLVILLPVVVVRAYRLFDPGSSKLWPSFELRSVVLIAAMNGHRCTFLSVRNSAWVWTVSEQTGLFSQVKFFANEHALRRVLRIWERLFTCKRLGTSEEHGVGHYWQSDGYLFFVR
jgi:hypothetical protein